jgi:hypothetical protein
MSQEILRICVPALSVTPVFVSVCQAIQSPVLGTVSEPVRLTPPKSTWSVCPL